MAKTKKTNFRTSVKKDVKKQQQESAGFGYLNLPKGITKFEEESGKKYFDIIPYIVTNKKHADRQEGIAEPGTSWYKAPFKVHRGIGANNDTIVCPSTFGLPCPICEYAQKMKADGAKYEEFKEFTPKKRNLYAVIEKGSDKFQIWDVSDYFFQKKLNDELDDNEDYSIFPDPTEGLMLRVRFVEDTFNGNKFYEPTRIDFVERDEQYEDAIVNEAPKLDDILITKTYNEIHALFFELDAEDEDEETEEEETGAPKISRKKKAVKQQEEDEDGEDEDNEEDDDDDEDDDTAAAKPTPKKLTRKKKVVKEEEDEDDEDEDGEDEDDEEAQEQEEEAPKPKAKPKAKAKAGKGKCPHGHTFGDDNDEHPECEDCDVWDECLEAMD